MDSPKNNLPPFPDETLDLKRYFFLFLGKWYWIAICAFAGLFVSYLINRYSEQIYSVNATLLIGNAEGRRIGPNAAALMREMNIMQDRKRIENEIGILKSYSFSRMAIDELPDFWITYVNVGRRGIAESKLYTKSPFIVNLDSKFSNPTGYPVFINIISKEQYELDFEDGKQPKILNFGSHYSDNRFSFTINLRDTSQFELNRQSNKYYFIINNPHSLALSYRGKLGVDLNDKQGSLLSLSSQGYVAQQEVDYINKLIEVYIRKDLQEKSLTAMNTIDFVEKQLRGISDSLRRAELMLQNFRTGKGIIDISTEGRTLLERLEKLHTERNTLSLQIEYFKYLEGYLKEKKDLKGMVAPGTIGIEDASITSVVNDLNKQTIERDALLRTLTEDDSKVISLNQKINSLVQLLFEKLDGMRQVNSIRIREIDRRVEEQQIQLRLLPVTERELVNMERMFNIHQKFYTYLMEKRIEAGIAKASSVSDNRIIDEARADMATILKPNKKMNYIMGLLIGLIIPVALILLFDMLDNSIKEIGQITQKTKAPILGSIGHNPYETILPVFDKPKSSFAESFRALRTNIDFLLGDNQKKAILVSSTISGEGKSFVASNLAVSLALLGKKTALLGLDLRKPKIHSLFSVDNSKGLSTYLIGRDNWADVVKESHIQNLSILPAGPIPPNPAELLASKKLENLFDELKQNFDFIVIDSPPVAVVTDAVLISRLCDTTLFVLRHRYTSRNVLELVEELSSSKTIKNIALLLNDFKRPQGYGYGYGYGYMYSYGYGYAEGYSKGYYTDEENGNGVKGFFKRFF